MRRIATPDWIDSRFVQLSDTGAVRPRFGEGGDVAYSALAPRFPAVIELVRRTLEDYVNDDTLAAPDDIDSGFPVRARMTGEFYLGDIAYWTEEQCGRVFHCVSIEARCLEKQWIAGQTNFDYFGLAIMIAAAQGDTDLQVWAADSRSI